MNDIKDFVSNVILGNNVEAKENFNDLVSARAMDALAERKQQIAQALFQTEEVEHIDEKAVSQQQQKFMGMVYAAKKGMEPASPEVAKAAASMTKKQAKDYAATSHEGLPKKVKQEGVAGAIAGGVLGGLTAGPAGAIAGGYLGHKTQQAANNTSPSKKM